MRVRVLGLLTACLLAVYGCGGNSGTSKNDAGDAAADRTDGSSGDRADTATDKGTGVDTGMDAGGPDVTEDAPADVGAEAGGDATADGRADGGGDASDGAAEGGAVPTCTDGIKNSDETGIDCGGHCGKCAPGQGCLMASDCQFAICKSDKTCGACVAATDCAGAETECQHRTCTAGVCGEANSPGGTVLTVQTVGDCKQRQCAVDGTVSVVNDNTDVPDDKNPCTNDVCTAGTPSHTLVASGTSCGGANTCNATGQCIGCVFATDCPGTDTPCRTRSCGAGGVCGFTFVTAGTKLTDPTVGDCKGLECDGAGNFEIFNDNNDVPADSNPCTNDTCSAGTASHAPTSAGTSCGTNLVCDGASACVECVSATDCPGTDTECHTRTCIGGHCGISNAAAGTALAAQTPKDCKKSQCDGAGNITIVNDDSDLPVDGNACTQDVCTQGMPSNPFITAGTTCAINQICDGQGACVGCVIPSNCPGSDTECQTRTCTNHTCGFNNKPAGTPLFSQTAGDCKKVQCDGSGSTMTVPDINDKPVDGNACTDDVCAADGTPSNPSVSAGTTCGSSLMCNGQGACVGCINASDCPGSDTICQQRTCTNGQCGVNNAAVGTLVPPPVAGDCKKVQCDGAGQIVTVADDNDLPVDGNSCTQDLCAAGLASNPPQAAGFSCSQMGGTRCNGAGMCVQCLQATDCPGTDTECHVRTCIGGACGVNNIAAGTVITSQTLGDCKKNICNGSGSIVPTNDDNDFPVDGNACTQDLCSGGVPSNPPVPANTPCVQGGGSRCNGSATAPACVQCLQASDCPGTDTECHTRTCTAGVCGVNNATTGTPVAGQTAGDCHKNVCNGSGTIVPAIDDNDFPVDGNSCTADVCTLGVPSNPPLTPGTACAQAGGSVCDATGACVQCLTAATCPGGPDTACHVRTCTGGACGVTLVGNGTLVTNTPVGDCHKDVCDGNGNVKTVEDDNDRPVDGNDCTADVCTLGVPSNPPVSSGTSCGASGANLVCDGNGACVGCLTASDCPGTDTTCRQRTCTGGSCGVSNAAVGTLVTNTPAGDCHKDVCDGSGNVKTVVDTGDTPTSANACLGGACSVDGTPSNPPLPAGTACATGNGIKCDGAGACVACLDVSDCSGTDSVCQHRTCTNGACGVSNSPFGTLVTVEPLGDCHRDVCDGTGGVMPAVDDNDRPQSPNPCLQNVCLLGVPSNPPQVAGFGCSVGNGVVCDGTGSCVQCLVAASCPGGADTTCQTKTCLGNVCGLSFADNGTLVTVEPAGDCQEVVCDGTGGTKPAEDDDDLPTSTNQCVQNVCSGGVPSNPPKPATTTCNQSNGVCDPTAGTCECDGAGACVECITAADCPGGPDTECNTRTCTNGVCGLDRPPMNTPLSSQTNGDCLTAICDGLGNITSMANDNDTPVNPNQCTTIMCLGGVAMTTNSAHGTTCTQNTGRTCDGNGNCLLTFSVVRIGSGTGTLTSGATPVFIDERAVDGSVVGSTSGLALPTTASGSNLPFTNSGTASSEGGLSLSGDGRYLVLAGYAATIPTAGVKGAAGINRVVARIDASGAIDTSTQLTTAFVGDNVRGATSQDGNSFWVEGSSTGTSGGIWNVAIGNSASAVQILTAPNDARWPHVFFGQLYGSADTTHNVFTVGTGLPSAAGQTATALPGLPTATASPFSFVLFDRNNDNVPELMYIADDGGATVRGIQKWTFASATWTKAATFNLTPTAVKFEGLAGFDTGSSIILIGTTDEALPRLVKFVDTGSGTPTGSVIGTSAANTGYHGVALSPHL
jgi:hypothetical protein